MKFATKASAFDAPWRPRGDYRNLLNLKSCEMQHPEADRLVTAVLAGLSARDVREYPYHLDVMARLAELDGVDLANVLLTAGSCSAIGLVVDGLAEPAGGMLLQEPVFDSWQYYAALRGVPVRNCPGLAGTPPEVTIEAMRTALAESAPSVVALTNPGNPAGQVIPLDEFAELAGLAADRGHVLIVDECYGAFAGITHVPLIARYPNLLVLRSLSKCWALAGARLAVVFGAAPMIDYLRRFRNDSTVSAPAVALASGLLEHREEFRRIWADVAAIRDEFAEQVLADHPGWTALRPGGNFITFATRVPGEGGRIERELLRRDIRIRGLEDVPGMSGCLRFSLADRDRMAMVAGVLRDVART